MTTIKFNQQLNRHPFLLFTISMVSAIGIAMLIFVLSMKPPPRDVRLMILFLFGTSFVTTSLAYICYRFDLVGRFPSVRWGILVTVVLTIVLIFPNVWMIARLMFISLHDLQLVAVLLIFAGVAATAFGYFITSTMTHRINNLSQAVERLGEGHFDTRLDARGSDEIAQLSHTFNSMVDSLQRIDAEKREIEQTRRDLTAWVSHDLRTPLASIQVMIEALLDDVVDDKETTERYLQTSLTEIRHIGRLMDSFFELSQLDTGRIELEREYTSLHSLISDTMSRMMPQAERQQIQLAGQVAEDIDPVFMDATKIQQVLYNLIDNAIRYTAAGEHILVRARRIGAQVQVDVHNTGTHIDVEHLPHIFDNFYRGGRSRAQSADGHRGTGLGLAIARAFVEAHSGTIRVESQPERGTTFSFVIPAHD